MKTAFITGASSGIGEACAWQFAKEGWNLVLTARRFDRLEVLAGELQARYQVKVVPLMLDVSNRASLEKLTQSSPQYFKNVSTLINNAGLALGFKSIQEGRLDEWDQMIDTNIKGLLYVTHSVLPGMLEKNEGHIINIGSVAGHWTYPKGNVYAATKYAVHALSESFRLDLNGTGIRVTEISPGMVETQFSEVRLGDTEKAKAVYSGMTPLTADDIAEAVLWCALRPLHVNIQDLVIYPTDQASPSIVSRK